jgi:hypothetical protein
MGTFGAIWGLAGVFLLLGSAVYRLSVIAKAAFSYDLGLSHWAALALCVFFMAYAEGYRAFQQRFSPRVAARAKYLQKHPDVLHALLGPLFCMGFFHATKRRKITSISVTAGIVLLIILVRLLPQPWRGIIDLSVVVGLGWGIVSLAYFGYRAFASDDFDYPPDVPDDNKADVG